MINGRLSNILEGCLEFLEFGRHGRALDFGENVEYHKLINSTNGFESTYDKPEFQSNHRGKRTRSRLKSRTCNCKYANFTYSIFYLIPILLLKCLISKLFWACFL